MYGPSSSILVSCVGRVGDSFFGWVGRFRSSARFDRVGLFGTRAASLASALALLGGAGCAVDDAPDGRAAHASDDSVVDLGTSRAAASAPPTLKFHGDFRETVSGDLERGRPIRIEYDASRLPACRGDVAGKPAWSITGYYSIAGGPVRSFEAGGFSPTGSTDVPTLAPDRSGELRVWFQNTSRWGCSAYDSDFGNDYRFYVRPAAQDPGWVGNVRAVVSRQTCSGSPCDSDMFGAERGIVIDTWARQRAAFRSIFFEVWKAGTTDFDNPDLWKQLDVQVHSRAGSTGPFSMSYVRFDRRLGNNARYAHQLDALDPIPGLVTITNPADCPAVPLTSSGGGAYVEAVVELYFTVNGVEVRPAPGSVYRVRYQNYASLYAPCL